MYEVLTLKTSFKCTGHPSSQCNDIYAHIGQGKTDKSDLGLIEIIHIGGEGETQFDRFLSIRAATGT